MRRHVIIKLDFKKAQKYIWDYKEYMAKYSGRDKGYKLLAGAPKIINISSHYVEIQALPRICIGSSSRHIIRKAISRDTLGLLEYKWIM